MTDITDQDRRDILRWARDMRDDPDALPDGISKKIAAHILATVEAPERTLAEELRDVGARYKSNIMYDVPKALSALAARAEQMETEWEEELDEISADRDHWCVENARLIDKLERVRDAARDLMHEGKTAAEWMAAYEEAAQDLSEARAEVDRLTAVRVTDPSPTLNDGSMTRHATVAREENVSHDLPEPADVKPGEAWIVNIDGVEIVPGFKASVGWICYRLFGGTTKSIGDERITLVSRLVPAPRVITNPDELDRLAEGSIVRDRAGHAWERYPDEDWYSTEELDDGFSSRRLADYAGPVTVLWEPGE